MSRPRFSIGGYVIGVAAGCVGRWLCAVPALARLPVFSLHAGVLCGALAVGLAIFVMVITDTEHPPAAGLVLGLVLNEACDARVLAVVLIGIVALSLAKEVLQPLLIDLL
jgi:CBS-domain-containing membrane protein